MRRWPLAAALVAALVVLGGPAAQAGESIDDGPWEGSALDPGPTEETSFGSVSLSGSFTRTPYRTFDVEVRARRVEASPGCDVEGSGRFEPDPPTSATEGFGFDETLLVPCNGTYLFEAVARTTNNLTLPESRAILDRTVAVAVPPPDVLGVEVVQGADRSVTVSWSPVAPRPPDHLGYQVVRTQSDGASQAFELGDVTQLVDDEPPAAGGDTTYSVVARRPGATANSQVRSANPSGETVTLTPAPVDTSGGGGTGGGTGGGGTGGGSGTGATTGRPGTGRVDTGGRPTGGITVPRVGNPSRNFFPALLAPPVIDTGFDMELPFEDQEPGEESPVLPDELASDELGERLSGRGLMVPVATGLVLAVWALHLRFLARASQPAYAEDDRVEIIPI